MKINNTIKTSVRAGGLNSANHNATAIKTSVRAGALIPNHSLSVR